MSKFSSAFDAVKFWTRKHAPELLIYGGTGLIAGAGVVAVLKTPKAIKAIENTKASMAICDAAKEKGACENGETYTEEDHALDIKRCKVQGVLRVAKEYVIPAAMTAVGAVMVVKGVHVGKSRTAAAVGLATATATSFAAYRANAKKRYGEKVDGELMSGKWAPETREETVTTVDKESGEVKTEKKTVTTEGDGSSNAYNKYARLFDQSCPKWHESSAVRLMKLDAAQRYFNDLMDDRARGERPGYIFYNEMLDYLGYPMVKDGFKIGYMRGKNCGCSIELGHRADNPNAIAFRNGYATEIILPFEGMQPILDVLPEG